MIIDRKNTTFPWVSRKSREKKDWLELLFPSRCACCDELLFKEEAAYGFCGDCQKQIVRITDDHCMQCGRPIRDSMEEYCEDCKKSRHFFYRHKALYLYQGEMKSAMYRFKYGNRREYARTYAAEAARRYGAWMREMEISAIIPVPLYEKKKKIRGYNQAELLAEELGRLSHLPVYRNLVIRIRNTRPQKELNDVERKNNLKNAFKIQQIGVKLNHILVVDDIYTTGSTLDGVTKVLLEGGAERVCGLSVCIGKGC